MRTLQEELEEVKNDNTKIGVKPPKIQTLSDVENTTYFDFEVEDGAKYFVPEVESDLDVRLRAGFDRGVQDLKNIPEQMQIYGGQALMSVGGFVDSGETVSMGRELIKSAYGELQADEKKFWESSVPLSDKDKESFSYGLGQGIANYGAMLAVGYVAPVAGIALGTALEVGQKAEEKIGYHIEETGDSELNKYTSQKAQKDTLYTTIYGVGSAIIEKKFGLGEQLKMVKMPITSKLKHVVKTMVSEGGTETLQELFATGLDWRGGYIDSSKLPERFMGALKEGAIGAVLGGGMGVASAINHRSQAKAILRDQLKNTVPEKDLDNVVDGIYESANDSMTSVVAQELVQSESLRNKHGAIYESIKSEISKQIKDTGAFADVDEMKLSQYIESTAKMFADQVLGEANKRKVVIDEVIKDSEIVYQDGKLYLQGATKKTKLKRLKSKTPSLLQFIRSKGGVIDEGGELKQMEASKQYIGLVNKNGIELDTMGEALWEAGYFAERPTVSEVLDYIDDELRGVKHYPLGYVEQKGVSQAENEAMLNNAISEYADIMEYDISKMSFEEKQQIYDQMQRNLFASEEPIVEGEEVVEDFGFTDNEFFQVADEMARLDDIHPEYKGETININGQEKTVYNSTGERIAKSKEALENFYKWFGDSKVIDEQGRPLVVYHGTATSDIKIFNTKKAQDKMGRKLGLGFGKGKFYFTTSRNGALQAAEAAKNRGEGKNPLAMPLYLCIENPISADEYMEKFKEISNGKEIYSSYENEYNQKQRDSFISKLDKEIKKEGYDGIIDNISGQISVFNPNQIKSTSNRGTYSESDNIYYQGGENENIYKATNSNEEPIANPANFNVFIEGSRVTDNDEPVSPSNPPKKIYRGDTRYFEEYEEQENAFEYDWGRGFYLSDNYDDILTNYQSGGADLKNRIDREAEQLANEEDIDYDEAREKIRQKYEQEDIVREFYLSIKEPVIIGGDKETFFDYTEEYDEETDEYGEPEGKGFELIGAIENYLYDIGADDYVQTIVGTLQQEMMENGGLTASQVEDTIRGVEEVNYLIDYESGAGELLSSAFGAIGFDGIIDHRAGTKFRNMNMDPDTTHYIVFNSEQAKSVDNKGEWGQTNRNFYNQITNLPKQEKKIKGSFDALTKSIKITSEADFSTYQHEFAHFWLDNIWNYANSGVASEGYKKQFEGIKKWLGVKGNYLTREQHEKFARAYEKYLYKGTYANSPMGSVFSEYENFIREVYDSIAEIDTRAGKKYKAIPKVVYDFFNSMTSGNLPYYGDIEEPEREVKKEVKDVKEYVEEESKVLEENTRNYTLKPVQTDTQKGYLTAYEKMTGQQVEAGAVNLEDEMKKAQKFVNENPEQAKRIVGGLEQAPEGMLKNTIYIAYNDLQKRLGNTQNRVTSLLNQAMELRRMGQEIVSQKIAYADDTSPLYWIRTVQQNKVEALADASGLKVSELSEKINSSIKAGIKEGKSAKDIAKELRNELGVTELFQEEVYPTNETDVASYNYIYKYVNEQLGLSMSMAEAETITRKADDMLASLENSMAKNGNPSVDFFVKQKDLENYANSLAPSSRARVLVSVIGRGNLLASIKSPFTNIENNMVVGILRAITRRIKLQVGKSIVSPELIAENKQYSYEIWKKTGYNVNNITPETPRNTILGEKITHSEGKGTIRWFGKLYEEYVYKWGLGWGDVKSKDFAFTDYVALKATKLANGDVNKANAIFKDACLIDPKTDEGKEIRQEAIQESLIATYQNKGLLSESLLKYREGLSFGVGFGEFLVPFVKTPANVKSMELKMGFGLLKAIPHEIIKDVKAVYRIKKENPNKSLAELMKTEDFKKAIKPLEKNIELVTQNSLGLIVAWAIASALDDDDYMPSYAFASSKDKQLAKELNIPFNAIRIGDTWISLDYFGALASPLVGWLQARREESFFAYLKTAGIQVASLPGLGNVADLYQKIEGLAKKSKDEVVSETGDALMEQLYVRSIPAIFSDFAKALDSYERETKGDEIITKIPFARERAFEKISVTSGKAEELGNPIYDILFGSRVKEQVSNDVADELQRLNNAGWGVGLTTVTRSGLLSELDEDTKQKVREDFAEEYSKQVKRLIKTSRYKRLSDEDKMESVNKIRRSIIEKLKKRYLKKRKK